MMVGITPEAIQVPIIRPTAIRIAMTGAAVLIPMTKKFSISSAEKPLINPITAIQSAERMKTASVLSCKTKRPTQMMAAMQKNTIKDAPKAKFLFLTADGSFLFQIISAVIYVLVPKWFVLE